MSFLFEIQKKKNKVQKKIVSMDVRAPQNTFSHTTKTSQAFQKSAGTFHFQYSPYSEATNSRKLDGVAGGNAVYRAKEEYAKRVSEMATFSYQQSKRASRSQQLLSVLQMVAEDTYEWIRTIHISLPGLTLTPNKLVYGSIVSGIAFGMVSLGLIEKTFESNATASQAGEIQKVETVTLATENYKPEKDVFMQYFSDAADAEYQANVREMVKGYPIEEMLPYIFEKDRITAAFLIGIAKKESNWGKRRPVLEGQDCFNYWGYRGQRRLMGSGGHTCFNSRKDAVDTVAKRLEELINSERLNTPEKLIVWKCGMSCEGHSRESVEKWISDVDEYYSEMMALEGENPDDSTSEDGP